MAASGFQHLTVDERRSLFRMREARLGVTEMASGVSKTWGSLLARLGLISLADT